MSSVVDCLNTVNSKLLAQLQVCDDIARFKLLVLKAPILYMGAFSSLQLLQPKEIEFDLTTTLVTLDIVIHAYEEVKVSILNMLDTKEFSVDEKHEVVVILTTGSVLEIFEHGNPSLYKAYTSWKEKQNPDY